MHKLLAQNLFIPHPERDQRQRSGILWQSVLLPPIAEFGNITREEYIKRGMELVQSGTGNGILGHVDKNDILTRYDVEKNEFAKGRPDRGIYTYFRPVKELEYYKEMKKGDLEHGGKK